MKIVVERALFALALSIPLVAMAGASDLPDPGSWRTYNPAVRQETIATTTCIRGWTQTVRPPVYITQRIKKMLLEAQGMTWERAKDFELDHVIPLFLGGETGDLEHTSNFQLQLWPEAERKDRVEFVAGECVCAGRVSLDEARRDLEDWRAAYKKYANMICRRRR